GVGVRRLVVAETGAEQLIELADLSQRRPIRLLSGVLVRSAPAAMPVAFRDDREQRLAAQRRSIGRRQLANLDLADALESLRHHLHVRADDRFAETAELLHVLLVHDLAELLLADAELVEERRDGEERAEERIPLHAQLQVGAVGGLARDLESRQREHPD